MHCLSKAMNRRQTVTFHAEATLHATVHGAKIRSIDEVLGEEESFAFDPKTDAEMEKIALRNLEQRKANHGG